MRFKKIFVGTPVAIFLTIGFTCESQHFNTFAQSAQTTGTAQTPSHDAEQKAASHLGSEQRDTCER
jgi:hypothetical protein